MDFMKLDKDKGQYYFDEIKLQAGELDGFLKGLNQVMNFIEQQEQLITKVDNQIKEFDLKYNNDKGLYSKIAKNKHGLNLVKTFCTEQIKLYKELLGLK